jgi:hypothetical protein
MTRRREVGSQARSAVERCSGAPAGPPQVPPPVARTSRSVAGCRGRRSRQVRLLDLDAVDKGRYAPFVHDRHQRSLLVMSRHATAWRFVARSVVENVVPEAAMHRRSPHTLAVTVFLALFSTASSGVGGIVLCTDSHHSALEFFGNTCCDAPGVPSSRGQRLASTCCTDTQLSFGDQTTVDSHRKDGPHVDRSTVPFPAMLAGSSTDHSPPFAPALQPSTSRHLRTVILRV